MLLQVVRRAEEAQRRHEQGALRMCGAQDERREEKRDSRRKQKPHIVNASLIRPHAPAGNAISNVALGKSADKA